MACSSEPAPAATRPEGPALEVSHLTKRYGSHTAVDDISLTVERGEIFGILGPNGAGKTTLVECAQGLRKPDGGTVRLLGLDADANRGAVRRRIGSQLQESALPDQLKVWEALDLFASLTPGATDWRVLLDQWGLADKAGSRFANLSGGQRQRLLVALALVNDPELVFLDEVTQGLDPSARRVSWDLIRQMRDRGTTVVLVTHYMDEAEQLCDRLAVFRDGRIAATGTAPELVASATGAVRVRFSTAEDVSWLLGVDHVTSVTRHGSHAEVTGSGPVLALVAAALVARGIVPNDLRAIHASLEDAFLALTGGANQEKNP